LTQFLRLQVASRMLSEDAAKTSTEELRNTLAAGEALEIAGYRLSPRLARDIDGIDLTSCMPRGVSTHWFQIVSRDGQALSPASKRVADAWCEAGVPLHTHVVVGEAFWSTVEIAECPNLLAATTKTVVGAC
jgi:exosortase A-associated hydrolase 2